MHNFTINKTLKANLPNAVENNELHFTEDGEIYINNSDGKLVKTGIDSDLINKFNILNDDIGDTDLLNTTNKNLVGAVNEIYNVTIPKIHKSAIELYQSFNTWGATVLGSKDLNDWTKIGSYNCVGSGNSDVYSNYPTQTDGWGTVNVLGNDEQVTQIFTPFNQNGKYYIRSRRSSSWTEWKQICTDDITVSTKSAILDANEAVNNGVYHYWNNDGMKNFPSELGEDKIGTLVVFRGNSFPMQLWSTYTGKLYYRARGSGITEWSEWHRMATYTRTQFNCTPETGYTFVNQDCFTQNGISYIRLTIKKSDDSEMSTSPVKVFSSPIKPPVAVAGSLMACVNSNGTSAINGGCVDINSSGNCYLICPSGSKSAIISFVI